MKERDQARGAWPAARAIRERLSYANVMATLAVFVALGGTSYAVATGSIGSRELKNNSVRSKDIRDNDVQSRDVRNRSLLAGDFKAGQLPEGPRGATGATGPQGPEGAQGAAGPLLDTLPSGRTLRGVYRLSGRIPSTGGGLATSAFTFQFPLAAAPATNFIPEGGGATAQCPGTVSAPAAAPGQLCVYEGSDFNVTGQAITNPVTNSSPGASRFGAAVLAESNGAAGAAFTSSGTWAVAAP